MFFYIISHPEDKVKQKMSLYDPYTAVTLPALIALPAASASTTVIVAGDPVRVIAVPGESADQLVTSCPSVTV